MEPNERLRVIFPRRLKSAMFEKNINAKQLADKVGVHKNCISYYVRGIYFPQMSMLWAICDALDVSADWLMGRVDKE